MSKRRPSLPETSAGLDRMTAELLNRNAEALDDAQRQITEDDERVLEYFWDRRQKKLRGPIPQTVILFFESDGWHATLSDLIRSRVALVTLRLAIKGYLTEHSDSQDQKYYELTKDGTEYLVTKHPTVLAYWEKLLALSPPTASLIVALVGLVASIMGIVQFIDWIRH